MSSCTHLCASLIVSHVLHVLMLLLLLHVLHVHLLLLLVELLLLLQAATAAQGNAGCLHRVYLLLL